MKNTKFRNLKFAHFALLYLAVFLLFSGCAKVSVEKENVANSNSTPAVNANTTASQESSLTGKQVVDALKNAGIPITKEVVFTEETDPNKLLNRPNQYIEKISWDDARMKDSSGKENVTLEVFKNDGDLQDRKGYIEKVNKTASFFNQYIYVHKNVLLRINHQLLPKQAEEYEKVFKTL